MTSPAFRTVRLLAPCGLLAAAIVSTGCGAPRVHEVYRLSALESMPEAASAIADERLTATQADLRRLAISARQLQPARYRQGAPTTEVSARPMAIVGGESRSLHGCPPDHLAEFTMYSAMLTPAEPRRAGAVFAASQRF